jgi:hypothetical protein
MNYLSSLVLEFVEFSGEWIIDRVKILSVKREKRKLTFIVICLQVAVYLKDYADKKEFKGLLC